MPPPPRFSQAELGNIGPQCLLQPDPCCTHWKEGVSRCWCRLRRGGDWGNEPITASRDRLQVERPICLVAEGVSNLFDGKVHGLIEINERSVRPQLAADVIPRDERACLAHEEQQQLEGLRLKLQAAI